MGLGLSLAYLNLMSVIDRPDNYRYYEGIIRIMEESTQSTNIPIPHLEIKGFRGISELKIPRFGRVSLLMGKNGAGKSSVAEAIQILCEGGSARAFREILGNRDELWDNDRFEEEHGGYEELRLASRFRNLFLGRPNFERLNASFSISTLNQFLSTEIAWWKREPSPLSVDEDINRISYKFEQVSATEGVSSPDSGIHMRIARNGQSARVIFSRFLYGKFDSLTWCPCEFANAKGHNSNSLERLWQAIQLTPLERKVISLLKILNPDIEGIAFRREAGGLPHAVVKLKGLNYPIPIGGLGDGVASILSLALTLCNAQNGVAIIDEIENGFHFSVVQDLWNNIFQIATEFNIQVIAITHSADCVKQFQRVALERPEEGIMIRLNRSIADQPTLEAISFDESEFSTVDHYDLEVR